MLVWQTRDGSDSFEAKLKKRKKRLNVGCGLEVSESIIESNEEGKEKLIRSKD